MNEKIKIFLVDDHEIFRNGLVTILKKVENYEIVGEAANGNEFISKLDTNPNIVLMDIKMPVMDGVEATKKAIEINPSIKIIALSMFGDEEYLQEMIKAGAKGFLLKNVTRKILTHAIEVITNGGNYYSEELLIHFTNSYFKNNKKQQDELQITKREMEILQLVSQGLTNQEIADSLFISKRTVDGHKNSLIVKTGSKNMVDLLMYSVKTGLIEI